MQPIEHHLPGSRTSRSPICIYTASHRSEKRRRDWNCLINVVSLLNLSTPMSWVVTILRLPVGCMLASSGKYNQPHYLLFSRIRTASRQVKAMRLARKGRAIYLLYVQFVILIFFLGSGVMIGA